MTLLEEDLRNLLEAEEACVDPADAPALAAALVANLPPEFEAAPNLLEAAQAALDTLDWVACIAGAATQGTSADTQKARSTLSAAIAMATEGGE